MTYPTTDWTCPCGALWAGEFAELKHCGGCGKPRPVDTTTAKNWELAYDKACRECYTQRARAELLDIEKLGMHATIEGLRVELAVLKAAQGTGLPAIRVAINELRAGGAFELADKVCAWANDRDRVPADDLLASEGVIEGTLAEAKRQPAQPPSPVKLARLRALHGGPWGSLLSEDRYREMLEAARLDAADLVAAAREADAGRGEAKRGG